ncbi:hypothetical protein BDY19DRAFT_733986 [Irpex rosettiformis]|uniref:Uncharacterized protein n=1 Tax=Irpex rosettiformis TaxID=378272 RepID=A0ACB8U942_9APHY|nr:hypothetical protein BDY19DRAFT_733986 [Irpex rosettiformis]
MLDEAALKRSDIQKVARANQIKANLKTVVIIELLVERNTHEAINVPDGISLEDKVEVPSERTRSRHRETRARALTRSLSPRSNAGSEESIHGNARFSPVSSTDSDPSLEGIGVQGPPPVGMVHEGEQPQGAH